ncbi:hypothetical protein CCACVL1_21344 [Corchorus capsularis]|uniref:Uncharacterized protein n=1 Tax=Corchorus capsularis TaxID=210143 RepID=A0A1R3H6E7_COCAP|nr:hypothetical protein CCACVL1_21344 [Corchorus capsularis]
MLICPFPSGIQGFALTNPDPTRVAHLVMVGTP